jgi:hypothetical protein
MMQLFLCLAFLFGLSSDYAARLLVDFLLSKDSQQFLRNSNGISGRADVEPLVPERHHSKLKLTAIDPQIAEDLNRHASEFREIYFR